MRSQSDLILEHMKKGLSITPMEALDLCGCWALSSRISDLRREGHGIVSQIVERDGKRFAKYSLAIK